MKWTGGSSVRELSGKFDGLLETILARYVRYL